MKHHNREQLLTMLSVTALAVAAISLMAASQEPVNGNIPPNQSDGFTAFNRQAVLVKVDYGNGNITGYSGVFRHADSNCILLSPDGNADHHRWIRTTDARTIDITLLKDHHFNP